MQRIVEPAQIRSSKFKFRPWMSAWTCDRLPMPSNSSATSVRWLWTGRPVSTLPVLASWIRCVMALIWELNEKICLMFFMNPIHKVSSAFRPTCRRYEWTIILSIISRVILIRCVMALIPWVANGRICSMFCMNPIHKVSFAFISFF